MKAKPIALAVTMSLALLPVSALVAEETPDAVAQGLQVQFNEMTCGDMLRQSGDARDFTMIYMHGVINGLHKDYLFDAAKVSEATDKIYDMCIADVKANLLEVFEKARSE